MGGLEVHAHGVGQGDERDLLDIGRQAEQVVAVTLAQQVPRGVRQEPSPGLRRASWKLQIAGKMEP